MHMSDVHVGTYIGKLMPVPYAALSMHQSLFDVFKALDIAIDNAVQDQVDFILITGDLFHRPINSRVILATLARRIRRLTEIAPVIILAGNHDIVSNTHMLSDVAELSVNNLHIVSDPTVLNLETKDGIKVCFVCAGWPMKTMISNIEGVQGLDSAKASSTQVLQAMLNDFAEEAAEKAPADAVKVFAGHGTMQNVYSGADIDRLGGSQFSASIAREDIVFYPAKFTGYDYVALGHIHLRACRPEMRVCYPGSIYPVNFSEWDIPHGYILAEIDSDTRELELIERDIFIRPYSNLVLKTSRFKSEDEILAHILENAPADPERFVRVYFVVDKDGLDINPVAIQDNLDGHYGFLKIDKTYQTDGELAPQDDVVWQTGDTVISLVKRYLENKPEIPPDKKTKIIIRLRTLINASTD